MYYIKDNENKFLHKKIIKNKKLSFVFTENINDAFNTSSIIFINMLLKKLETILNSKKFKIFIK